MLEHISRKPVPQMEHRRSTTVIRQQTAPPKLQKLAPALFQNREIILIFAVKLSDLGGLFTPQKPVNPNHPINLGRVHGIVDKDHVIKERIEPVLLKTRLMIDHRAAAAKLLNEHPVTQPLRRHKLAGRLCEF